MVAVTIANRSACEMLVASPKASIDHHFTQADREFKNRHGEAAMRPALGGHGGR